ncbi:hypothetical protein [Sneathiella glossodoripedis]|uniref:hypothetical protein n=1 Tax=Sneathiella glossodoripedis TaxID=418853 RepID=UPI0004705639|nr:hypothetical protein [Sneathiella glossodoripedis]
MKKYIFWAAMTMLTACSGLSTVPTSGEQASGYGYVPLDGLAVEFNKKCVDPNAALKLFPDVTLRFAVGSYDVNGELTYGPATVTTKGQTYKAILDYVNIDAVPITFLIRKRISNEDNTLWVPLTAPVPDKFLVIAYDAVQVIEKERLLSSSDVRTNLTTTFGEVRTDKKFKDYDLVTMPVYIGVGLRLIADIVALEGKINLSGLGVIGAEAGNKKLTGKLTVQTIGVNGSAIGTILPLPSKLDQTTIENGILALGSGRTSLYNKTEENRNLWVTPRVVGLYSPVGTNSSLINALYSALSKVPPRWQGDCTDK